MEVINSIETLGKQLKPENIWSKLNEIYENIPSMGETLDFIVNSENHKYYISLILILVFILIIILINLTQISDKYIQIITLLSGGLLLSIFYFFAYRNYNEKRYDINGKINPGIFGDEEFLVNNNDKFNKNNFKTSILNPLFNLFKFTFFLLGIILAIVLILFHLLPVLVE